MRVSEPFLRSSSVCSLSANSPNRKTNIAEKEGQQQLREIIAVAFFSNPVVSGSVASRHTTLSKASCKCPSQFNMRGTSLRGLFCSVHCCQRRRPVASCEQAASGAWVMRAYAAALRGNHRNVNRMCNAPKGLRLQSRANWDQPPSQPKRGNKFHRFGGLQATLASPPIVGGQRATRK